MTSPLTPITLSPYLRIRMAGFDVDLKTTANGQHKLHLKHGDEIVATFRTARNGNLPVAEALRRVKLNLWGGKADLHIAVQQLAEKAEELAPLYANKNV